MEFGRRARAAIVLVIAALLLAACSPASHPAGWKPVDFYGVRIYIPANWPVRSEPGTGGCQTWPQSAVILTQTPLPANENILCELAATQSAAGTWVILRRITPTEGLQASAVAGASKHTVTAVPETFHGLVGLYTPLIHSGTNRWASAFVVYKSGVAVSVSSPDVHLAQEVVHTVRPSSH